MEYIESDLEKKLTMLNVPKNQEEGEIYKRDPDSEREREILLRNLQ
jgi:hypothetical protein